MPTFVYLFRRSLTVLAFLGFLSVSAITQTRSTGTISGHVADSSGAAVRGAQVSLVNTATGLARNAVSDNNGGFTIGGLPLTGLYEITVKKQGFSDSRRDHLDLVSDQSAVLNFVLQVAGREVKSTSPARRSRLPLTLPNWKPNWIFRKSTTPRCWGARQLRCPC